MSPDPANPLTALSTDVRASWQRFLDVYEPLRPELYRYCRYLTRSPWDAEDLAQDALARAFATLGTLFEQPKNPRAWLFRVASNLWVDRQRRQREVLAEVPEETGIPEPRAAREAAATLLVTLSPQERAAVVLKDVFEFTLEEVAEALSTTVTGVKAALHRARGKLTAVEAPRPGSEIRAPAAGVLDAFGAAFNAHDVGRLTALLLDTSVVRIVGVVTEYGPEAASHSETGSFPGMLSPIVIDHRGGVEARWLDRYVPVPPRVEVRAFRDEPLLLFWYEHEDGEAVRCVARARTEGEHLVELENYFFSPDVIAEVCQELGVPFRVNGYRYWRRHVEGSD